VLTGFASVWASLYTLLIYVIRQSRIATATGVFLDMIALDFFQGRISRNKSEPDTHFRLRILTEILRPRATRAAVSQALTDLTGIRPIIFEPADTTDTGGYNRGGVGYNVAGGWGDLDLPFQAFITAFRPSGGGISGVSGYGNIGLGITTTGGLGGYGQGTIEWANLEMIRRRGDACGLNRMDARLGCRRSGAGPTNAAAGFGLHPIGVVGTRPGVGCGRCIAVCRRQGVRHRSIGLRRGDIGTHRDGIRCWARNFGGPVRDLVGPWFCSTARGPNATNWIWYSSERQSRCWGGPFSGVCGHVASRGARSVTGHRASALWCSRRHGWTRHNAQSRRYSGWRGNGIAGDRQGKWARQEDGLGVRAVAD
jgi:hypothetical protein